MTKEELIKKQIELGFTNKQLAEALGVTVRAISYYKNGQRNIPDRIIKAIKYYPEFKRDDV